MSTKKQIDSSEWLDRLQSFSSGNKGRTAAIAAEGMTIAEQKPLISVDYDPVGKGNDIVITLEGFYIPWQHWLNCISSKKVMV